VRSRKLSVWTWALVGALSLLTVSRGLATSRPAPIGTVIEATGDDGSPGLVDAQHEGMAVYDGDTLKTGEDQMFRVRLNGPQMIMRSNSLADVHAIEHGFSAVIKSGTVVISMNRGQEFKADADGIMIRPVGDAATVAEIALVSPNEIILGSEKGPLELELGTEKKTLEPGNSYRVEVNSDQQEPGPRGQRPKPAAKSHFTVIAIGAVAVGTTIVIWRAFVSPSVP
jgi:hypothetical protein